MRKNFTWLCLSPCMACMLSACGFLGSKTDPTAANRTDSFQEAQERANSRREVAPVKTDTARVAASNLGLAAQYYAYGQYATAQEVVIRSLQVDPGNPAAWSLAGSISYELNDQTKAKENFARSLELGGSNPDVLHNYATYLCQSGNEMAALTYFDRALAIPTYTRPASSETGAGACLLKMGKDAEAEVRFENAMASEPLNPQALFGGAQLALKFGKVQRARDLLTRYQQVAPVSAASLWLAVQIGRLANNKSDVLMAAQDLRNNYPDSAEVKMLNSLGPMY